MSHLILTPTLSAISWQAVTIVAAVCAVLVAAVIGIFTTGRAAVMHVPGADSSEQLEQMHQQTMDALSKAATDIGELRTQVGEIERLLKDVN